MEEMDDFGDLYADVEGHANSGFLATPIFYLGEEAKKDEVGSSPLCSHGEDLVIYDKVHESNGSDDQMKARSSILDVGKETHISKSCSGEKREGDDDCNGRNGIGEAHKFDGFVEEGEKMDTQGMEEEGEWCVSQGSDSEDDLHIVLNDDHRSFRSLRNMSSGHGGVDRAEDDEDEDDDLVIVTDKDRKWVERLQVPMDGMEQIAGGGERGNVLNSTGNSGVSNQYHSQYSQFKYIRPNGSGKTPCCGKGDVDLNGGSQQMMAYSGFISSSSNLGGPALAQNGFDFFLPRNRTILDIDIGTLEQKPWTHPGVDITDFFNFGLNEESWKLYCRQLEQLRQQTSMQTNIAFYESPKPCQPKGRAIQVEGGIVERLPSIDVRRPRVRDSDVVIQVALQDAMEDSSVSGKEGADPLDDSISKEFGKGGTEMEGGHCGLENLGIAGGDAEPLSLVPLPHLEQLRFGSSSRRRTGSCPLKRCSQPKAAHAASSPDQRGNNHVKVRDSVSTDTKELLENVEDARERYKENPSEAETVLFENRSEIADKILSDSCSANLESHSEGSKAGFSIDMEEVPNSVKNSSRSLSRLRESFLSKDHLSGNSGSVVSHSEPENICQDQTSIQEKNYCGRKRLRSVAEIKVPIDDIDAPLQANGKSWYNGLHRTSTHGRRKENMDPYDSYRREDVSYHREREISNRFCRRRLSGKQVRDNTHSTHFQSKDLYFRDEVDLYVRRNWSEREYFVKQSVKYRDNERNQGEYYFDHGGVTENESAQSSPEYISIYSEKDRYLKRREWDDYFSLDHRHEEESIRQRNGKCVSYCGRKIENPDRRERGSCSPSRFDFDNSWKPFERDGGHWVDPDSRSPNSKCYRNIHSLGGRDLHDESPSRNLNYDSWRLRERDLGFWREPDCKGWFVSSSKEPHSLRHRERDSLYAVKGPYLYERSSRQEHKFVNHDSVRGREKIEDLHIDREMGKFDLIGWEGKFPRRCAAEDPKSVGQWDRAHVIDMDSEPLWGSKNLYRREVSPHTQKVENDCPIICSKIERVDRYNSGRSYDNNNEKWLDKYPIMPECEASAAKEEPEDGEVFTTGTEWVSVKTVPISDQITEKKLHSENALDKNKVGGYDDGHILETLAKMERRRERFKEPVIIKKELDETPKPPPPSDLVVETATVKQQRPARKRRWCSS